MKFVTQYRVFSYVVNYLILTLIVLPCADSCILLLNGWTPLSVYERTGMADAVASGFVMRTFKDVRTDAHTYSAEVKILQIYKGVENFREVTANESLGNIYNISNFGDKKMCYADIDENESYIFFLTVYKERLSAQYDDIFGAAVDFTEENEDEVIQQLGWDFWSSWSSCTASCDVGVQVRRRACQKKKGTCDGSEVDQRQCNTFSCKGTRNVMEIFNIQSLPVGISRDVMRPSSFNITQRANLYSPLSSIFRTGFPIDFSIILTARLPVDSEGYLFTLSDIMGKQRLSIKFGDVTKFEYYDQNDLPGFKSPSFDVSLTNGEWHQVAFSIKGHSIKMYVDCIHVLSKTLSRSEHPSVGVNLMASIGPYFARYGRPFEGQLEQLTIASDPSAAAHQCFIQTGEMIQEPASKDDGDVRPKPTPPSVLRTTTTDKDDHKELATAQALPTEWSSWSSCSTTCGSGQQTRSLYCLNNEISVEECVSGQPETSQSRVCFVRECPELCPEPCLNGGSCGQDGQCHCPSRYYGQRCQFARCRRPCKNGGNCTTSGQCSCPEGFSGRQCGKSVCSPKCRNGGRCVAPGVCSCPFGYTQPICKPFCTKVCHNGGRCVRHNTCKCRKGYTGKDCSKPICKRGCYNGGKCVAPNKCSCPRGYKGRKCQKAVCNPTCQNAGVCIYPYVCRCKPGYYGSYCQEFTCRRSCKNGGKCIGHNKCECLPGYSGKWCQRGKCAKPCQNGGRCRRNKCRCPKGYGGQTCERKGCKYEKFVVPYQKTYRRLQREEFTTQCGPWRWRTCVQTRLRYVTQSKTLYRTSYRCI
ncbi:protein kinase C-binding protein NELL2-like isoform X1 [Ylistrum balloti]|uniref:protein kinase C-binding protein NELL2-like isoform X1 n=1 Tax=Ylistrum balloti TaxID=509963 RepID=UPI002905A0CC|nr:protein kinase C-binding protein NELL2-like isoform X1 [Ylistrum balloti]